MSFAFIFPGQGSQSLKMMDGISNFDIVNEVFLQAKTILGVDFLSMLQEDNADNINQTINTQPLMLSCGFATYLLWRKQGGIRPSFLAGHSLGEWTALVASGVITFMDALKLVKIRAASMQDSIAVNDGAMAAILGLDDNTIINICKEVEELSGKVVSAANFNSPGQVVIAGDKDAVVMAGNRLKEHGAKKVQLLAVSVPSHCSLMLPASKVLRNELTNVQFNPPQIPVLHNCDTQYYDDPATIKQALVKQLYSPVLWTTTINKLAAMNISHIVECGPGKVLSNLNKRINPLVVSYCLHNQDDLDKALAELQ